MIRIEEWVAYFVLHLDELLIWISLLECLQTIRCVE